MPFCILRNQCFPALHSDERGGARSLPSPTPSTGLFVLPCRIKDLLRCCAGATVIEYALVVPLMLLLLLGIVEYSLIMYASSVLEGSINLAARAGKTGYAPQNQTRQQYMLGLLQQQASGLLAADQITLTTTSYDDFTQIGQSQGTAGLGNAGDVVVYTATYPWPVPVPLLQDLLDSNNNSGVFTLISTTIVKNEPFNSP